MIRAAIAIFGIACCFILPSFLPKWKAWPAPRLKLIIIGILVAFAIIATVIASSNTEASFVYVSF